MRRWNEIAPELNVAAASLVIPNQVLRGVGMKALLLGSGGIFSINGIHDALPIYSTTAADGLTACDRAIRFNLTSLCKGPFRKYLPLT